MRSLFRVCCATLLPEAVHLHFGIDFGSLKASFFDIFHDLSCLPCYIFQLLLMPLSFSLEIHVFVMLFAHFPKIVHRRCREFLPASCFQVFRFYGQDLKVSAVALRLQSILEFPFWVKK